MVFGTGYAAADDVVGHELTHGYVEHTAGLFYLHQSGALNESLADTIGEIIDHRNPRRRQRLGVEDRRGPAGRSAHMRSHEGPARSPASPTQMTSDLLWPAGDVTTTTARVHLQRRRRQQDGLPDLAGRHLQRRDHHRHRRRATRAWPRPACSTSTRSRGSPPARSTPTSVASWPPPATSSPRPRTGGFTTANCAAVRSAVAATELRSPPDDPAAAAPEAAISCPSGTTVNTLLSSRRQTASTTSSSTRPRRSVAAPPDNDVPSYAPARARVAVRLDPDPSHAATTAQRSVTSAAFTVPTSSGDTYLQLPPRLPACECRRDDDPTDVPRRCPGAGPDPRWSTERGPRVTGCRGSTARPGTSRAARPGVHRVRWRQHGLRLEPGGPDLAGRSDACRSASGSRATMPSRFAGWWIDDVRLYACDSAGAPARPVAPACAPAGREAATTSATVSWRPRSTAGAAAHGVPHLPRSDGKVVTVSGGPRTPSR